MNGTVATTEIKNENEILKYIRLYHSFGWSLVPCGADKRPLIDWKQYQTTPASLEQVLEWTRKFPGMNIGVITGAVSGIVAIDIEKGGNANGWTPTVCSRTGGEGTHLIYKHPGQRVRNSVKDIAPLTDVRGDGGFIVLPPSISEKGAYSWVIGPELSDIANLPASVLPNLLDTANCPEQIDWKSFEESDVPEGTRNTTGARYAGKLISEVPEEQWEALVWPKLKKWNASRCKPSLQESELRNIFNSIATRERSNPKKEKNISQSTRLVGMVLGNPDITLFQDEYGVAHANIPINDHSEIWPCRSTAFTRWLSGSYYRLTGGKSVASRENLKDAVGILEGRAINDSPEHRLFNRSALTSDAVWYDLADEKWRAVRITRDGWDIAPSAPLLFRRFSHLAPQVEPTRDGSVRDVLQFVNITDPEQQILFLVHLVSSFIPGWPHPALYVYGSQGSAKSTLSRIVRKLTDPSKIEVVSLTRKEGDLAQQLGHHSFLFFDNVSEIPDWIADLLCRAITGGGFSKRELFTNDDDVIRYVMANIGINGINIASNRADLLERSLLLRLERVSKGDRKQEYELMADFERARPGILGAIFDTIAKAMAIRPSVRVDELPRMADFALWGSAVAEALGFGKDAFLSAYLHNIGSQSEELIHDSTVATLLIRIAEAENDGWSGMPTELFKRFKDVALTEMIQDKRLPANPAALMREINRLKTPLEETGWQVISHGDRSVTIRRFSANCADGATDEAAKGGEPCP